MQEVAWSQETTCAIPVINQQPFAISTTEHSWLLQSPAPNQILSSMTVKLLVGTRRKTTVFIQIQLCNVTGFTTIYIDVFETDICHSLEALACEWISFYMRFFSCWMKEFHNFRSQIQFLIHFTVKIKQKKKMGCQALWTFICVETATSIREYLTDWFTIRGRATHHIFSNQFTCNDHSLPTKCH